MANITFTSIFHHLLQDEYDDVIRMQWFQQYSWYSIVLVGLYISLVFKGREWMQSRPKLSLRVPLTLWSLSLAVFSARGAYVMLSYILPSLYYNGLQATLCSDGYYDGTTGLWVCLFSFSKAVELLDTMFVVLRKQKLIVLHWYHHALTLVYSCYSYQYRNNSPGQFNVMSNFTVHTFMYTYYAVRATGLVRVPKQVNIFITSIQIIQMAMGITLSMVATHYQANGTPCYMDRSIFLATMAMYTSYLVLFIHFFVKTYFPERKLSKQEWN